jgi:hypothetical protein
MEIVGYGKMQHRREGKSFMDGYVEYLSIRIPHSMYMV